MREIKFRAWDKELKIMDYGKELTGGIEYECSPVRAINIILNEDDHGFEYMQYTGLKDKNGKEIYEGDVLKDDENFLWEVTYNPGYFGLVCGDLLALEPISVHRAMFSEVIGNIYENPELLKGENNNDTN